MAYDWFSIWYEPDEDETVAYLSEDRIAEIGGATPDTIKRNTNKNVSLVYFVELGIATLARWCRQHCQEPGSPVNVRGRTGWAFKHESDALLFKLTWGG